MQCILTNKRSLNCSIVSTDEPALVAEEWDSAMSTLSCKLRTGARETINRRCVYVWLMSRENPCTLRMKKQSNKERSLSENITKRVVKASLVVGRATASTTRRRLIGRRWRNSATTAAQKGACRVLPDRHLKERPLHSNCRRARIPNQQSPRHHPTCSIQRGSAVPLRSPLLPRALSAAGPTNPSSLRTAPMMQSALCRLLEKLGKGLGSAVACMYMPYSEK